MATRHFSDGHYWVRRTASAEPEVAVHDNGSWHLHHGAVVETESLHRIGRRFEAPADAFEDDLEQQGRLGV
jgi:hypothetical protein